MAMIRWIIETALQRRLPALTGAQAMRQAAEKSWTNATHLVITDDQPELAGQHLTLLT
jgi:tetrathionate reductase subunit A